MALIDIEEIDRAQTSMLRRSGATLDEIFNPVSMADDKEGLYCAEGMHRIALRRPSLVKAVGIFIDETGLGSVNEVVFNYADGTSSSAVTLSEVTIPTTHVWRSVQTAGRYLYYGANTDPTNPIIGVQIFTNTTATHHYFYGIYMIVPGTEGGGGGGGASPGIVGLYNASDTRINPATEDTLASVIGTDGSAGPASAVSMAGTDGSGDLQEVTVDTDGDLQVDVLSISPGVSVEQNLDGGTATGGAASTVTDTNKDWETNQWAYQYIDIISGTGAGQHRIIASNTATVITVTNAWSTNPDNTSVYRIYQSRTYDTAAKRLYAEVSDGTNSMPTMDAVGRAGYVSVTDGTNTMPTMDAVGRAGYVSVTDGTNTMPTMDAVGRAGYVQVTDGTNTMPTMDAVGRAGYVELTDGTNEVVFVDLDTGAGTEFSVPISVRTGASGGSVEGVRVTDGTNYLPTMDAVGRAGYITVTDGTNTMPTMDAVGRAGYITVTDGTNTMPTMDAVGRAGYVTVTDGTNEMPTMDAVGRAGYVELTDGTNEVAFVDLDTGVGTEYGIPISVRTGASGGSVEGVKITDGTNYLPMMDAVGRAGYITVTDGTNTMPTMDAVGRAGYVTVTDGTNEMPTMDTVGRAGYVSVTDGTNTMPTMDAVGRAGYITVTDGTNTMPTMDAVGRAGYMILTDGTDELPIEVQGTAGGNIGITAMGKDTAGNVQPLYMDTSGRVAMLLHDGSGNAISQGIAPMANSLPVTIASDQDTVNVSVQGAQEIQGDDTYTTTDSYADVTSDLNVGGYKRFVIVVENDGGGGKSLDYKVNGYAKQNSIAVELFTGTMADGDIESFEFPDNVWDYIEVQAVSSAAGQSTTLTIEWYGFR